MAAICVYCASSAEIDPAFLGLAAAVGTELARRGHTLVSGGGRASMMGAVAVSARAGGAHTLGVIPQALVDYEVADTDADELVVVDTMRERKAIMEARADAFIALPGGIGTLEELFEIWTSATLGMHQKPVLILDADDFYRPLTEFVESLVERRFVRDGAWGTLLRATSVPVAFDLIETALAGRRPGVPRSTA